MPCRFKQIRDSSRRGRRPGLRRRPSQTERARGGGRYQVLERIRVQTKIIGHFLFFLSLHTIFVRIFLEHNTLVGWRRKIINKKMYMNFGFPGDFVWTPLKDYRMIPHDPKWSLHVDFDSFNHHYQVENQWFNLRQAFKRPLQACSWNHSILNEESILYLQPLSWEITLKWF